MREVRNLQNLKEGKIEVVSQTPTKASMREGEIKLLNRRGLLPRLYAKLNNRLYVGVLFAPDVVQGEVGASRVVLVDSEKSIEGFHVINADSLQLDAGTATLAPIYLTQGTLLTTPVKGALEFANNRFYLTNVAVQRAIDRTSDVVTTTVTVANSAAETTLYTGSIEANTLQSGNVIKVLTNGVITNATASDDITLRIYIGATLVESYNPATSKLTGATWDADFEITVRSAGVSGSLAFHSDIRIFDGTNRFDDEVSSVETIDTTAEEDVTVTAQWDNAKLGNTISLYQGFMEFKN